MALITTSSALAPTMGKGWLGSRGGGLPAQAVSSAARASRERRAVKCMGGRPGRNAPYSAAWQARAQGPCPEMRRSAIQRGMPGARLLRRQGQHALGLHVAAAPVAVVQAVHPHATAAAA